MKNIANVKTAYTHNSIFHADDVFAAAMLLKLNPDLRIIRTNDDNMAHEADLQDDSLAFDIGQGEYDHHQEDKALRPIEDGYYFDKDHCMKMIPYCSFGLLWRDYGHEICPNDIAWKKVDRNLVLPIDKTDNGIARNALSSMIDQFNPNWDEDGSDAARYAKFMVTVYMASVILDEYVKGANSLARAAEAIAEHSSVINDNVLVLDKYIPWQDVVIESMPEILFVVFPSSRNPGRYNVLTVPTEPGSFVGRKLFPEYWLGKTNEKLGITFCHTGNFMLEADTLENAINCAKTAAAL